MVNWSNTTRKMRFCVVFALFVTTASFTAVSLEVEFEGLLSNSQGLVGHGGTGNEPFPPIYDTDAGQWIDNPFAEYYNNGEIYSKLSGVESFSTAPGSEGGPRTPGEFVPPFQAAIEVGHNLESLGITETSDNQLHFGTTSLTLDYTSPTDYYLTDSYTENRVYRGGTIRVYEQVGSEYNQILEYKDVVITIRIDWLNIYYEYEPEITVEGTGFVSNGENGNLPLIELISFYLESERPVDVEGMIEEPEYSGYYAFFTNRNGQAELKEYVFDFQKLSLFVQCWLANDDVCMERFDLDGNEAVDFSDLSILAQYWDYSAEE